MTKGLGGPRAVPAALIFQTHVPLEVGPLAGVWTLVANSCFGQRLTVDYKKQGRHTVNNHPDIIIEVKMFTETVLRGQYEFTDGIA